MSEEIVSSEDIQFYEYLGLLEQAYYDTHVGSKAGTIITETIKSYVNILKYKNNKLQQKVEQLEKENKELKQPQVYIDCENMEERYGRDLYEDYLKEKIEQLENIRKEAIECIETDSIEINTKEYGNLTVINSDDLLNILNKGDNEC